MPQEISSVVRGNVNWYLFNLYGIEIENQENWNDFIFGDATLVNCKQFIDFLLENEIEDHDIINHLSERYHKNHTFLVVRQMRKIEKEDKKKYRELAEQRAYQVASFIFFAFFYLSNYKYRISLDSQIYEAKGSQIETITNYGFISSSHNNTAGEYWILLPKYPYKLSQENLLLIFNNKLFHKIFYYIQNPNKENLILSSLMNLYLTSNVLSPVTQLLGSVTSIEILLKDDLKYEKVLSRIRGLLGEKIYNQLVDPKDKSKGVFELRHNVSHQGHYCDSNDALKALKLASYVIIAYSHIIEQTDRINLLRQLDYIEYILREKSRDIFGVLKQWEKIKVDEVLFDWTIPWFISFYGLCTTEDKKIPFISYAQAIVWHSKLWHYDLIKSYKMINEGLYYRDNPFKTFEDFKAFYDENMDEINNKIQGHEKYYNFNI